MLFSEELFTNLFVDVPYLLLKTMILQIFGVFFSNLSPANLDPFDIGYALFLYLRERVSHSQLFYGTLFLTDDISFAIPQFLEFRREISSFAMFNYLDI